MKVLMAQDTFLPNLGGAEVHVWQLSKALLKRGHQVKVVTATQGPSLSEGLSVHRFPLLQSQGKRSVGFLPLYLPKLMRLVLQHEVVHGHYTAFCSAVLGTLAGVLRRPFVVTLHGYGTLESSVQGSFWLQRWRRLAFRAADRVIATSREMAEVARRFVPDSRIVTIPNGVDTEEFAPSRNGLPTLPVRIVTVRRLVPKNGVQYLVEAAPLILEHSPKPVEFWIVGDGSMRRYLEERVQALGIKKMFRFVGA
ncbi:MAG: glycosyltransferase family 4 protein, partial [Candidatus Binatia bacterium]